jgi:hypothetical protein
MCIPVTSEWDRLVTQMIRAMIQQFLARPTEFFSFGKLAKQIPGADADILHAIAEGRPDLFVITKNSRFAKLTLQAIRPILLSEMDLSTIHDLAEVRRYEADSDCFCDHSSDSEILNDLKHGTLPAGALTNNCCWKRICLVRGRNMNLISPQSWEDTCRKRGYLLYRRNPSGF